MRAVTAGREREMGRLAIVASLALPSPDEALKADWCVVAYMSIL
jgi:hypothetical protein